MATEERLYTVDDVWQRACAPENETYKIFLIDGELLITMSPGRLHGRLALRVGRFIADYADKNDLGEAAVVVGYHSSDDRHTLLIPDVAFEGKARAEQKVGTGYVPFMPDLAVEIISPSQSLVDGRRKAKIYLSHGTVIVWLVHPAENSIEIWTIADDNLPHSETIALDGELTGGTVLPGFTLPLWRLFPD